MTENNRYTIDVEEETQENAVFFDKEFFVCFADDTDKLLELINAYNIKDNGLIIKINELEDEIQRLKAENKDLICKNDKLGIICAENGLI